MNFEILSLHFSVALSLTEFAKNFIGVPGAIFAVCLWCFRTIWRSAK